jgi:hypothetical protein
MFFQFLHLSAGGTEDNRHRACDSRFDCMDAQEKTPLSGAGTSMQFQR